MRLNVIGNSLEFNGKTYQCAIGKSGFAEDKKEGDNKTPIGEFLLREVYYRNEKPKTVLKAIKTEKNFGWCDDVNDKNYNKFVELPYPARHENLWREDHLYDLVVVIGYNEPGVKGNGSAIFMHLAKPGYEGTEGCIALKKEDLLEILAAVDAKTTICLNPK